MEGLPHRVVPIPIRREPGPVIHHSFATVAFKTIGDNLPRRSLKFVSQKDANYVSPRFSEHTFRACTQCGNFAHMEGVEPVRFFWQGSKSQPYFGPGDILKLVSAETPGRRFSWG